MSREERQQNRLLKQQLRHQKDVAEIELKTKLLKARTDSMIKAYKAGVIQPVDGEDFYNDLSLSWKDEFLLFLFSSPLVLSFIPPLQDDVQRAFEIINTSLPDIYMDALFVMLVVVWGARRVIDMIKPFRRPKPTT